MMGHTSSQVNESIGSGKESDGVQELLPKKAFAKANSPGARVLSLRSLERRATDYAILQDAINSFRELVGERRR